MQGNTIITSESFLKRSEQSIYVKSTHASVAPFSSTNHSAYEYVQYPGLYHESSVTSPPLYSINELTGINTGGEHGKSIESMCYWLSHHLMSDGMSVQTDCRLDLQSNPLYISVKMRPDLIIKNMIENKEIYILQFEVQSNSDRIATIQKLGYGL